MRIAVLTEGDSEWGSLPVIFPQLRQRSGNEFTQVMRLTVQPDGPVDKIARACKPLFKICTLKRVDLAVIVLDREQRADSPGDIATKIADAVQKQGSPPFGVAVVLKDRAFENWVIADVAALKAQAARFKITSAMERSVVPNKADRVDAIGILKNAAIGKDYDKVPDARRTLGKSDVKQMALNSRSFRHFLHVVGDPDYVGQCQVPAA